MSPQAAVGWICFRGTSARISLLCPTCTAEFTDLKLFHAHLIEHDVNSCNVTMFVKPQWLRSVTDGCRDPSWLNLDIPLKNLIDHVREKIEKVNDYSGLSLVPIKEEMDDVDLVQSLKSLDEATTYIDDDDDDDDDDGGDDCDKDAGQELPIQCTLPQPPDATRLNYTHTKQQPVDPHQNTTESPLKRRRLPPTSSSSTLASRARSRTCLCAVDVQRKGEKRSLQPPDRSDSSRPMQTSSTCNVHNKENTSQHSEPDRDEKLFNLLEDITTMVQNNGMWIKKLAERENCDLTADSIHEFNFPMKSKQDVERVDELLNDRQKMQFLVRHLSTFGGSSTRDVVDRILSILFTNPLATMYNWRGQGTKLGLAGTNIARLVRETAKASNISEAESENGMKNWLKYAHGRGGQRQKALEKKERDAMERARMVTRMMEAVNSTSDDDSFSDQPVPEVVLARLMDSFQ